MENRCRPHPDRDGGHLRDVGETFLNFYFIVLSFPLLVVNSSCVCLIVSFVLFFVFCLNSLLVFGFFQAGCIPTRFLKLGWAERGGAGQMRVLMVRR